jgi:type I restriction-modification system DNA methylase subunit
MDPACGSGHFLLAAARRLAEKLAELRSVEEGKKVRAPARLPPRFA